MVDEKALEAVCKEAMRGVHLLIRRLGQKGAREIRTEKDRLTQAEKEISPYLERFLRKKNVPAVLYTEEFPGPVYLVKKPTLLVAADDIDGTDNYAIGANMLPYCSLITIFDSITPCFKDALIAVLIEHLSGNMWSAVRGKGVYFNGKRVSTSGKTRFTDNKKDTRAVIDHFMSAHDIGKFLKIYSKAWVKDHGSGAFHFAQISRGKLDLYMSTNQKAHELCAGYLFVTEGGGAVTDLNGKPLGGLAYDFNDTYGMIAASSLKLAMAASSKIR